MAEGFAMPGKKGKIPIEKIEKKEAREGAFSKRRCGLFRMASKLCLEFGAQMAIIATPPSENSNVSFYSFGHSSTSEVIDAFLENRRPYPRWSNLNYSSDQISKKRKSDCVVSKKPLGFWWEDEGVKNSNNIEDLRHAIDDIKRLRQRVALRMDILKNKRARIAADSTISFAEDSPSEAETSKNFIQECDDFIRVQNLMNNDQNSVQIQKNSDNSVVIIDKGSSEESEPSGQITHEFDDVAWLENLLEED